MLRTRAISSVVVVLVAILPALFGPWAAACAFIALGALALHELAAMLERTGHSVLLSPINVVVGIGIAAGAVYPPASVFMPLVALAVLLPGAWLLFRPTLDHTLTTWLGTTFAALFIALPLMHAVALRSLPGNVAESGLWLTDLLTRTGGGSPAGLGFTAAMNTTRGMAWLLFALVTVWFTDVGAFAVGQAIGRHPLIPHISPKKTWEGFWGGLAGGAIAAAVANYAFGVGLLLPVALLAGAGVAAVATVGDLAESLLKRQAGVKDSGSLIPGHGGVLDRMDSQLYAFVAVYYLALLIG